MNFITLRKYGIGQTIIVVVFTYPGQASFSLQGLLRKDDASGKSKQVIIILIVHNSLKSY